jgi:hypothetical protein
VTAIALVPLCRRELFSFHGQSRAAPDFVLAKDAAAPSRRGGCSPLAAVRGSIARTPAPSQDCNKTHVCIIVRGPNRPILWRRSVANKATLAVVDKLGIACMPGLSEINLAAPSCVR